jgi:hypothetical protein
MIPDTSNAYGIDFPDWVSSTDSWQEDSRSAHGRHFLQAGLGGVDPGGRGTATWRIGASRSPAQA